MTQTKHVRTTKFPVLHLYPDSSPTAPVASLASWLQRAAMRPNYTTHSTTS